MKSIYFTRYCALLFVSLVMLGGVLTGCARRGQPVNSSQVLAVVKQCESLGMNFDIGYSRISCVAKP